MFICVSQKSFALDFQADFSDFREQLQSCSTYEKLISDSIEALMLVHKDIIQVNFESCDHTLNRHERLTYFCRVAHLLICVTGSHKFQKHINDDRRELLSLEEKTLSKISEEMCHLQKKLASFLICFPENEAALKNIYSLAINLDCIEKSFQNERPRLSRIAHDSFQEAMQNAKTSLVKFCKKKPSEDAEMLKQLLLLKKACYEIPCWRNLINEEIDEYLKELSKKNSRLFLLDLSVLLRNITGDRYILAQQLLSDHSCFEGVMNGLFDEATVKQDINYVLDGLRCSSSDEKISLGIMYQEYEILYRTCIQRGMLESRNGNADNDECFLNKLAVEGKKIASDYTFSYSKQVSSLTAHIFAYWTLSSNALFKSPGGKSFAELECLKKPHAAQVVAVWLMLNVVHGDYQELENCLVQVSTGEGKSIVLGVTATILALLGVAVDCVCYSSYLSSRDYNEFKHIFASFGVTKSIRYGTIQDFSFKLLKNYWVLAEPAIRNIACYKSANRSDKLRVLLVDEVDVFFGDGVFGEVFCPGAHLASKNINNYFKTVWENCRNKNAVKTITVTEAHLDNENKADHLTNDLENGQEKNTETFTTMKAIMAEFPQDCQKLIERQLFFLRHAAKHVKNEQDANYTVFRERICCKYFDGLTATKACYKTKFRYIKEAQINRIKWCSADAHLCLSPILGAVSFAEYPFEYNVILGVTGTLEGLESSKCEILTNKYGIKKFSYIPSVFGKNKLKFAGDHEQDFIICDTKADFYLDLKQEILRRLNPLSGFSNAKRAVLVFFESKEALLEFYNSSMMSATKSEVQVITEAVSSEEREGMFLKATEQGAITLMIRDFGRGTDFKCFDRQLLNEGGVHVIQAFFSMELSEEIQIKGRSARQGANGSFSIVLNAESLRETFEVCDEKIAEMKMKRELYSCLALMRKEKSSSKVVSLVAKAVEAEDFHYRTLTCEKELMESQYNRKEVIEFFEELNHLSSGRSFRGSSLKDAKHQKRKERLCSWALADKEKRHRAQKMNILQIEAHKNQVEKHRIREMLSSDDWTNYSLLGVNETASQKEIIQSFRKLSLLFHPDKCNDIDAQSVFQKICKARDGLSSKVLHQNDDENCQDPNPIKVKVNKDHPLPTQN